MNTVNEMITDRLTRGVLRVGGGRGFVAERRDRFLERIVITAAHCLPKKLPSCHPHRPLHECTYGKLLGPLGGKRAVWAECIFVDPIADIAVLAQPDNQELSEEAEAYDQLVESMEALPVADAIPEGVEVSTYGEHHIRHAVPGHGRARVLSLEGRWLDIDIWRRGGIIGTEHAYQGGMSGSPIVDMNGAAIGVVSTELLCPVIADTLSVRLMRDIAAANGGEG